MKRFLLALFLACSGVVLTQMPAHACTCANDSLAVKSRSADAVFSGTLTGMSGPEAGQQGDGEVANTTYAVSLERVYKGTVVTDDVEITSPATSCSLGALPVDRRYIFFVRTDGAVMRANQCGGTGPATAAYTERVQQIFGTGSVVEEAEPAGAEMTRVADTESTGFARLAAPGAAALLIGMLGLVLVRRLGR